ncbi:unnamed protein product [Brachionus calyciflorus]|uniref:Uncharacterized protein n=1 Tax=Brachionus calyciflorus TaxID=104777 RepID=A0A813LXF4_9BILA|nr:unnamed protein product [Brachionus calyciflorus]
MASVHGGYGICCPKCTYVNSNRPKNCTVCNYDFESRALTLSRLTNNQIDTNNNNSNKKYNVLKNTLNDVKQFINGLGSNSNKNSSNLDDSVIEIDPKTSDPVSKNIWRCKICTFAANPDWANKCEICNNKRERNDRISPKSSDKDSIVYDHTLKEGIYDYARIWSCSECTFINFERDTECELCLAPRKNKSSTQNSPKSKENTRNLKDKWICKSCTYLNTNNDKKCVLCQTAKEENEKNFVGSWTCETCAHKNSSKSQTCEVCSFSKDYQQMEVDEPDIQDYDNNYATDYAEFVNSSHNNTLNNNQSLTYRSHKAKSLIKQYANATNQAERIWNNIVKYCKENKHKFVDDSFPPCDKSLFIDPKKKPQKLGHIQWLSPEYVRTHPSEQSLKWNVYNDPKFNDIKQGLLGNCWLLSGLAVILEQPELLRRIIITKDYCPQGCYQVRLCKNGEWQTVILDDMFPCDQNGQLIYSQASRKQLWVPLIEKAMAKLNGSYESLIAGQTVEGLSALTGYPCDSIRLETGSNEEEIDLEMIWVKMLSMKEAGYALGASCGRTDIPDDKIFTDKGLLPRHAYSVLAVKEVMGYRLIQLRNPWGRYTWTGDWSENSKLWTPEIRRALGLKSKSKTSGSSQSSSRQEDNHFYNVNRRNNDEGVFWISFYDFVKFFCSIDVCKTRLDWLDSRVTGYFSSEGTREMLAFTLIVFETCEIDIGLFHKTLKNRRENGDLDLCFVVLRSNGRKNSVGKLVVSSKRSVRRFVGCEHIFEPGEYLIVPCSFNFWYTREALETNNNLYNLVIHSTKVFYLEQEMHSAFLLADTMIQLVTSLGSKTSSGLENACIYTLAKGYSGIIVVAENLNENAYLHVELDCERSNNVVSTRQALLTKDSVPPLHRQVLILLTQLEGSNSYSIQYSIKYRLSSNPYLNTWPGNEGRMVTNLPPINKQTFGLHVPRSVFN